jgi:hypothetical protein
MVKGNAGSSEGMNRSRGGALTIALPMGYTVASNGLQWITSMPKQGKPSKPTPPASAISYSIAQAVAATGLSRSALYEAKQAGQIEFKKWGRHSIITADALAAYVAGLPSA